MSDIIQNKLKRYTGMTFPSGPISAGDIISDKPNNVHNMLYNDALNKLLYELANNIWESEDFQNELFKLGEEGAIWKIDTSSKYIKPIFSYEDKNDFIKDWIINFKRTHKIIEIKNNDYLTPSNIIIINNKFPYNKEKYSLEKYWDKSYAPYQLSIDDLSISDDNKLYGEIIYINYANGMCKLKSKFNEEFWVPFKYITENTPVNENMSLSNTFTSKYINKEFGY